MMKNMNWKKYAGAAMAAAMIPALVAPIATEAAVGSMSLTEGKNIVITTDGKLALTGAESAKWFDKKQVKVVSTETGATYTANENGVFWVPADTSRGIVYEVHDVDGKKTTMTVWAGSSTKAVLDYSAEVKAEAAAKAKAEAAAKAKAEAAAKGAAKAATVAIASGYNINIEVDGKLKNDLFKTKDFELVGTQNAYVYKLNKNGYTWLAPNQTYEIYDVTDGRKVLKGKINVASTTSNVVTLKYLTVQETETINASDVKDWIKPESNAYFEKVINGQNKGFYGFDGIIMNDSDAKLIVSGEQKTFEKSINAHATASIEYDLTGKNVSNFTGLIGFDERREFGAVNVVVRVDGEVYGSPFVLNKGDEAKALNIDLTGAETLQFFVTGATKAENPNQNAIFVLGDGQFHKQVEKIQ